MVEIISKIAQAKVPIVALLLSLACAASASAAEPTYSELVAESETLKIQEDSISKLVTTRRKRLASAGDERATVEGEIVKLELELFDLRSQRGRIIDQVTLMEKSGEGRSTMSLTSSSGVKANSAARQISDAEILKQKLPAEDYKNLKRAERAEAKCGAIFESYMSSYDRLRELKQLYDQAKSEGEAIGYSDEFERLMQSADSLSMLLSERWVDIYDNKSFAYSMAIEILGDAELMARETELTQESAAAISMVECSDQSAAALDYDYQKRAQNSIELLLAKRLGLTSVADSLQKVVTATEKRPAAEDLAEISFVRRNFILYEPIKFVATTPYNTTTKPIPMATEYKRGVIYRIQFGAYKYEQLPTIFRGVVPMSKDRALGFWTYYGGGYETLAEAEEAVALCKRRGFKRPEVVIWRDGVRRNLYRDPLPKSSNFRVVISGAAVISEEVKAAIKSDAPDAELSKVGAERFILSPIVGKESAEKLIEALELADESIECSVVAIE